MPNKCTEPQDPSILNKLNRPILPRPILSLRLELILISSNGRRTPHPLQLTLHVMIDMFLILLAECATPPTDRSTGIVLVKARRGCAGSCVAGDGRVEVASVADRAGCGGTADGGASGEVWSAGAREDVIEVVRGGGEGGAGGLGETAVDTGCG